jgi:hypothetical protein
MSGCHQVTVSSSIHEDSEDVTFYGLPTYFFLYFSDPSPYFPNLPLVLLPQDCPTVLSWSLLFPFIYSQPR